MTHFESETLWARPRSRVCDPDSSMAMMDCVHVWFRPFRDELSLRRNDGRAVQNRKGRIRRKSGETADAKCRVRFSVSDCAGTKSAC